MLGKPFGGLALRPSCFLVGSLQPHGCVDETMRAGKHRIQGADILLDLPPAPCAAGQLKPPAGCARVELRLGRYPIGAAGLDLKPFVGLLLGRSMRGKHQAFGPAPLSYEWPLTWARPHTQPTRQFHERLA